MTRNSIFDASAELAMIAAAFFVRNAVVLAGMSVVVVVALAN
jgi:hypothetical protein